jgi:hypothetical protein
VSGKLLDQFVAQLKETVLASPSGAPAPTPAPTAAAPATSAPATSTPAAPAPAEDGAGDVSAGGEPAPVDLLRAAAAPVLVRLIPLVLAVAVVVILLVWLL